jgi:UDP-GlcNAc:undecaprenyl-phosphate GlcNAc-1-phosphate transferase
VIFPFNFFLAAFAGAFLTTLLVLPLWRKWCLRTNLVDDPGHRKIHNSPIPLAGGFAVLTGILLPLAIGAILLKLGIVKISSAGLIIHGIDRRAIELAVLALGSVAITILGWLDDKHELKALPKFIGQFLIAFAVAAACKRITLFVPSEVFSYAVTILWLLTVINAFNFMDNMNGLCAGLGAIGAFIFALIAAANGEYLVAITGFLMPHFYTKQNPRPLAVLAPLLVLAVPLLDLAQVSLFRTLNKKPFWSGDTNHLSHRLVRAGMSRPRAVLVIWLIAAVVGSIACLV